MEEREYVQLLSSRLDRLRSRAIRELRSLLNEPETRLDAVLDVEIFPDSLFEGMPIRLFLMSADGGAEIAPSRGLLDGTPDAMWTPSETQAIVEAGEEGDGFDRYGIDASAFVTWFAQCWTEAGGRDYPLRAFVGQHDGDQALDLHTGEWVQSESRWRTSA